jgi:hypothetical protein
MCEILKPFEGKQISKRMETAAQKAFPDYRVRYKTDYGLLQIEIIVTGQHWNRETGVTTPEDKLTFLIGYEDSAERVFSLDKTEYSRGFKYLSVCYGEGAKKRIEYAEHVLQHPEVITGLAFNIDLVHQARERIEDMTAYSREFENIFPAWYAIKALAGLK